MDYLDASVASLPTFLARADSFQEWKDRGERGAPAWGKIPHVFVRGKINVEGLEIFDCYVGRSCAMYMDIGRSVPHLLFLV